MTPGWCRLVASTATGSSAASSVLRRAASATPTACYSISRRCALNLADARDPNPSFLVPVGSLQGAARHETMVYLTADGSVVEKRSLFRLSLPLDILWGVIDFVSIFFQTLIDPEGAKAEMRRRPRGGGATGRGGGPGGAGGGKKIRGMKDTQGAMSACGAGG